MLTVEMDGCVMTFSAPSSRRLPRDWLELSRWCITSGTGSQHWREALKSIPDTVSTIVSYSDPSAGHTGALYRACGWVWAPTWHVLRPPPSGNGVRGGKRQEVKHRWVYLLKPDDRRQDALCLRDASVAVRYPSAGYREPRWRRGRPVQDERAAAFRRWAEVES